MPIYEFYCVDCHRIFNFLSRTADTRKTPGCPRCGRTELERRVSAFAISKGRKETEDGLPPDLDETRMERAMEALGQEIEGVDENDPRQMARMMRKLYDALGQPLGGQMEEAVRRLEAGEDPEALEQELGGLLDEDAPFPFAEGARGLRRRILPPAVDDELYEL